VNTSKLKSVATIVPGIDTMRRSRVLAFSLSVRTDVV
jgi:hypothetical protein